MRVWTAVAGPWYEVLCGIKPFSTVRRGVRPIWDSPVHASRQVHFYSTLSRVRSSQHPRTSALKFDSGTFIHRSQTSQIPEVTSSSTRAHRFQSMSIFPQHTLIPVVFHTDTGVLPSATRLWRTCYLFLAAASIRIFPLSIPHPSSRSTTSSSSSSIPQRQGTLSVRRVPVRWCQPGSECGPCAGRKPWIY